jgi:hypothetical protein
MLRKLRTRKHIIEDLGFNYIERKILNGGFTMYRIGYNDYGYDGYIQTFTDLGEIDSVMIHFQLKSTDSIKYSSKISGFAFDLSVRDLELWLKNTYTTLLILYDAQIKKAYYIDLQVYFQENMESLRKKSKFVRINIPNHQIFNKKAVKNLYLNLK